MKNQNRLSLLIKLFLSTLYIGAFTFGGGYAMLSLLQNEFVVRRKWIDETEFIDLAAIAESTPGPIAINAATYTGFKVAGVAGSVAATLGICIPSFTIIYIISRFLDRFLEMRLIACAFRGIQVCVIYLILSAGLRMLKSLPKTAFQRILMLGTAICMLCLNLFAVSFSSIFLILICGTIGLIAAALRRARDEKEEKLQ